jgi:hypothetical protein
MPARYRPRTKHVDAGAYSLQIDVRDDGGIAVAVVHASAARGSVDTVAYLRGRGDAAGGGALFEASDAHDAANRLGIAAGGGRPS